MRHWPGSALASELSRRLASAQSAIVSAGGGVRIVSARRTAWIRRGDPCRIRRLVDRQAAELRERFGDRVADARAGARNGGLLVQERGEPIGQNQEPGPQPFQHRDPGGLDLGCRQQVAAAGAGIHLGEIGFGLHQPRPLRAEVGGAGLEAGGLLAMQTVRQLLDARRGGL